MTVVDASTLAKYILHEEGWEEIGSLIRKKRPLYSVDHVLKEAANTLWKHCIRRRVIDEDTTLKLYQALLELTSTGAIILEPETEYLQAALEIALKHEITLYDSLYIAQAQRRGELLTSDKKQAEIAEKLKIKVHLIP